MKAKDRNRKKMYIVCMGLVALVLILENSAYHF